MFLIRTFHNHPMAIELFFYFEIHLLVYLHDMIMVDVNIIQSVNISLEFLSIFTAALIMLPVPVFHENGHPLLKIKTTHEIISKL